MGEVPLSDAAVAALAKDLHGLRATEATRLDLIHEYLRDDPQRVMRGLPSGAPREVRELARIARVNMVKFVVNSRVQSMYVDGFRSPRSAEDLPVWEVWRKNRMGSRQIGVHRAALGYGAAYVTVLPGKPVPVLRGVSPRRMTASYGDDDTWPLCALEKRRAGKWRLYDTTHLYELVLKDGDFLVLDRKEHGARMFGEPVCPVVRHRDTDDLDADVAGLVEPLMSLQDQINVTTFGLLVAQHYGAFRQRYILGWLAENEEQRLRASASKLWTFADHPEDIKVGEFAQTDLAGFIESREATLRHLSTVSQTPAHELLGQLVNLSAEALAAAEAGKRRAITENQTVIGESHEQALGVASEYQGRELDASARVRWRDTEARSMGMVADALGKISQQLQVPPEALWERIPGVTDDDIERWKTLRAQSDSLANLEQMLTRQSGGDEAELPEAA